MRAWLLAPLGILLAIGIVTLWVLHRRKRRAETAPLTLEWRDGQRGK